MTCGHARVAVRFRVAGETVVLLLARARDPFADRCRMFFRAVARNIAIFNRRHFDVKIDPVEKGTGNSLSITLHLNRAAPAFAFEVAKISARAGMQARAHESTTYADGDH